MTWDVILYACIVCDEEIAFLLKRLWVQCTLVPVIELASPKIMYDKD